MRHPLTFLTWLIAAAACLSGSARAQITESFEGLAPGQLDGQGGWRGWDGNNTPFHQVSTGQNHTASGTQSVQVVANGDSVREITATSGNWIITAWSFCPTGFAGKTYFIVMNEYSDLGPYEWGAQIGLNGDTGLVECDCGSPSPAQRALVFGSWADIVIDVDLDTGTTSVYYDTASDPNPIATYQWTNGVYGQDNFTSIKIAAINLAPDSVTYPWVTPIFMDDISVDPIGVTDPPIPYDRWILLEDVSFQPTSSPAVYDILMNSWFADFSNPPADLSIMAVVYVNDTPVAEQYQVQVDPGPPDLLSCGGDCPGDCTWVDPDSECSFTAPPPWLLCTCSAVGRPTITLPIAIGDRVRVELVPAPGAVPELLIGNEAVELEFHYPFMSYCPGDGSLNQCPCDNSGAPGEGCANSSGSGAYLIGTGEPSIAYGSSRLTVFRSSPAQPGLFFQGANAVNGGNGVPFGDGLRCAGGSLVRLQLRIADSNGEASTNVDLAAVGGVTPGDTKYYQWWYRDPGGSPCGNGFNLSNGLEVTWAP